MLQHCCSKGNPAKETAAKGNCPLTFADFLCHRVQLQAHLPCQGNPLVLVRPRCKDEEKALGAGLEILMTGLGEGVEAPWSEEDKRQTRIEGRAHHSLLSFRYCRRDKDCPLPCPLKEGRSGGLYLLVSQSTRTLNLQLLRIREEKPVAYGGVSLGADGNAEAHTEEVRISPLEGQTTRVVTQIGKPAFEFPRSLKDMVVVAAGKEISAGKEAFLFVVPFPVPLVPFAATVLQQRRLLLL